MIPTAHPKPAGPGAAPRRRALSPIAPWALLGCLAALLLAAAGCGGAAAPTQTPPTPTLTPTPMLTPVPTPPCVEPSLALGATRFRVESLAPGADGSLAVPADTPGLAYWVEGTNVRFVFALSLSAQTLALKDSLRAGDAAVITWADCLTDTFEVEGVEADLPDLAGLLDQSSGGLTVFAGEPGGSGLLIAAVRPRAQSPETPEPTEEGAVQADMAFGETTVSADGAAISLSVTITNTGELAFSLTQSDLSLTPDGLEPQAPLEVEPALPHEIAPGEGVTFQITFAHPGTQMALLRILDITLEQYF